MGRLFFPLAAALACGGPPVLADPASAESLQDRIVITGEQKSDLTNSGSSATKTPTNVLNVPQSVTTISKERIAELQLRSVGDLLLHVPGASYGSGEGNRDQLVLRGNASTADFFVDGVRDDVQYFRDFYNVERIDVLNGPNAMIFGRGGGGGVINRILKQPHFINQQTVSASTDNWGAMRFTLDTDQRLSPRVGLRLAMLFEDSSTFRRDVRLKRDGINPTLAFVAGPHTRVNVGFEHFHDWRTVDRGVPANGDTPLEGYSRSFFGDPNISYSEANADILSLVVEQHVSDSLTLKSRVTIGDYRKFYQNLFPSSYNPQTSLVTLSGYNNLNNRTSAYGDSNLVWDTRVAGIVQTLLVGLDAEDEHSRNRHLTASFLSGETVPLTSPRETANVVFAPIASDANNRVRATVAAVYAQDQIEPARWIEIIGGLRLDRLKIAVADLRSVGGGQFDRTDSLVSPRLGVMLKPSGSFSFYASLSRSYLPQSGDQFSALSSVTEALKPERFDNRELGIKLKVPRDMLARLAIYRLDRTNTRATDPANPAQTVLTGAQRSRGLEFGLEGNLTRRWQILAGYSLQKASITRTTAAAPAGRQVPLVPRHSLSLWNRLKVTRDAGIGIGLIARSKSFASVSNTVELPGYERVDAAFYLKLSRQIEVQLNMENLLDVHYFPTANADNNIIPGAPRTLKASLRIGL